MWSGSFHSRVADRRRNSGASLLVVSEELDELFEICTALL
jgi:ABC-type uncharacterized transport system ATPase subunit